MQREIMLTRTEERIALDCMAQVKRRRNSRATWSRVVIDQSSEATLAAIESLIYKGLLRPYGDDYQWYRGPISPVRRWIAGHLTAY